MADGQANIGLYDIATKQKNVILIADNKKKPYIGYGCMHEFEYYSFFIVNYC